MSAPNDLPSKLLKAILEYVGRGWLLFPARPDKTPYTKRGLKDATGERDKLLGWWKKFPSALIALRTGPESGLFVLDFDIDKQKGLDGTVWLAECESLRGALPRTPRARTPRGGLHLYFAYPVDRTVRNSTSKLAPGVDVRGIGGYAIVPPSRSVRGEYKWEISPSGCPVAEAPEWLLNLVCEDPSPAPESGALTAFDQPLPEADQRAVATEIAKRIELVENARKGTRNHTLNVAAFICGKLIGAKVAVEADLEGALLRAAEKAGLSAIEATRTIRSGFRAGKCRPWRPHAESLALAQLNRDFFFALDGRTSFVFREDIDPRTGNRCLTHITLNAFRDLFANQFVNFTQPSGKETVLPLGTAWLKWAGRRQFHKVAFAPGKNLPATIYNQWQGFAAEPIEGDCSKFLDFLREVICSGDADTFHYLIQWCARAVQEPSSPGQVAVVMRGAKGTGKTFFAVHLGELFGDHFVQMSSSHHLVGNFNAHLETAILALADEAYWAGDRQGEGTLKTLITSATIRIERKGIDSKSAPNHVHLIMASNSDWVVPASADERRYLVLDVSSRRAQNHSYFDELEAEWQTAGREAFMHRLLNFDLSSFNVRKVPQSQALLEQKLLSLHVVERWYLGMLREGRNSRNAPGFFKETGDRGAEWVEWVSTEEMLKDCREFAGAERSRVHLSPESFGMRLVKLLPPPETADGTRRVQRGRDGGGRAWGYSFPSLESCRSFFENVIGSPLPWETEGPVSTAPPDKYSGKF